MNIFHRWINIGHGLDVSCTFYGIWDVLFSDFCCFSQTSGFVAAHGRTA